MMFKVAAIVRLPRYGANYDAAHNLMAAFVRENKGKLTKGDRITVSFRESLHMSEGFLLGLSEYIRAHEEYEWSIQYSTLPDGPEKLMEFVSGLTMLAEDCTPYVERPVQRL